MANEIDLQKIFSVFDGKGDEIETVGVAMALVDVSYAIVIARLTS